MATTALVRWREKWGVLLMMLAASMALHAAGFAIIRAGAKTPLGLVVARPEVRLLRFGTPGPAEVRDLRQVVADMFDPSLISLPNSRGFSAGALATKPTPAPKKSPWNVEPSFLPAQPSIRDKPLVEASPLSDQLNQQTAAARTPTELPVSDLPPVPQPSNHTTFLLLGDLAGRAVLQAPQLPVVTTEAGLRAARLTVGVRPDGQVQHVMLERTCGDPTMDQKAVESVRRMRLASDPTPGAGVVWGTLKVLWAFQLPGGRAP